VQVDRGHGAVDAGEASPRYGGHCLPLSEGRGAGVGESELIETTESRKFGVTQRVD